MNFLLRQKKNSARAIGLCGGEPLVDRWERSKLLQLDALRYASSDQCDVIFLGCTPEPVFAVQFVPEDAPKAGKTVSLRDAMAQLNPEEAAFVAAAWSLFSWHEAHPFCSACGARSVFASAGWERHCLACGTKHYPRSDPVAIVLVTNGDNVLLGRNPGWPEGLYSLLAGFVEPGETISQAAQREVFEEAGIVIGAAELLHSQPWPFPASLMIGCRARALSKEIQVNHQELEDAQWVSRAAATEMLDEGRAGWLAPPEGSIARALLEGWARGVL